MNNKPVPHVDDIEAGAMWLLAFRDGKRFPEINITKPRDYCYTCLHCGNQDSSQWRRCRTVTDGSMVFCNACGIRLVRHFNDLSINDKGEMSSVHHHQQLQRGHLVEQPAMKTCVDCRQGFSKKILSACARCSRFFVHNGCRCLCLTPAPGAVAPAKTLIM